MNLFLDTSTILAACGSDKGASNKIFVFAPANNWLLLASPYVVREVVKNLNLFPAMATARWIQLRRQLIIVDDVFAIDRPTVFPVSKDRPVLFTALASAKILLTFDRRDFGERLGGAFYQLAIFEPADFFDHERLAGRLKQPKK